MIFAKARNKKFTRRCVTRVLCGLCILVMCILSVSCSEETTFTEAELRPVAESLIERARVYNTLYFGEGIPAKTGGLTSGNYAEADPAAMEEMGFSSVADIREKTAEVYSSAMCRWLFERAFTAVNLGTEVRLAQYCEIDRLDGDSVRRVFMVYTRADSILNGDVTYDYDSFRIVGQRHQTVNTSIIATVTTKDGLTRTVTMDIDFIKTDNGWRLDSPTYLVFDAESSAVVSD